MKKRKMTAHPTAAAPTSLSILIVDDHPVVRGGLEAMLRLEKGFRIHACVASGEEALAACRSLGPPEVALLDVRMPGADGFEVLSRLRGQMPGIRVLMLAGVPLRHEVSRARELGACGYLSKSAEQSVLLEAIRTVHGGGTAFMETARRGEEGCGVLTAREQEVLEYLGRGLSREDIAKALGIGSETVKTHVKSILTKLDAADRTEAVAIAYRMGLLSP
jgi:DNA-binding NarL/FixJ family response regulator